AFTRGPMHRWSSSSGSTLLEMLFVSALAATLGGIAVPQTLAALDDIRAAGAARYVSGRLQRARMEAVLRSAEVAIKYTQTAGGYSYAVYVDGNRNGVRGADITTNVDRQILPDEKLTDFFKGVDFGALPSLPPVDSGGTAPGSDPIRLGSSDMASFSARGTSSTGTLYIRGQGSSQYAVRLYGETGKTRILKFDPRLRRWNPL
ncbi:MAG TPA: GspH/FimT family pseudopilin, partial [Vicinamibacterales bacterium]|nr:GspH/FimT family pseudopilin [Vicinamibacterales bacterium]